MINSRNNQHAQVLIRITRRVKRNETFLSFPKQYNVARYNLTGPNLQHELASLCYQPKMM
jgi:hypothetical protein